MPMVASEIESLISKAFPQAEIILKDLVGDNNHYEVTIKSAIFNGKSKIEQHRMVNRALHGYLGGDLHALSIKTLATE
jgi:stress-induced morphogen